MTLQVGETFYFGKACSAQQFRYPVGLVITMLKKQPATWIEAARGFIDDTADGIQAVGAGGECQAWLEADIALLQEQKKEI